MPLALFDLDNTLIAGDSDYAWGQFMVTKGLADNETYAAENERFYQDYLSGTLDPYAYQRFSLAPLRQQLVTEIDALHQEFMHDIIKPMLLPKAMELIEHHRKKQDRLLVITATNRVITQPIVAQFGIADLVCSETAIMNGRYTGELAGEPCMGEGKVTKLNSWAQQQGETLMGSTFYSDSHNDLPLLKRVDNPVAVDPDDTLLAHAEQQDWQVISLR